MDVSGSVCLMRLYVCAVCICEYSKAFTFGPATCMVNLINIPPLLVGLLIIFASRTIRFGNFLIIRWSVREGSLLWIATREASRKRWEEPYKIRDQNIFSVFECVSLPTGCAFVCVWVLLPLRPCKLGWHLVQFSSFHQNERYKTVSVSFSRAASPSLALPNESIVILYVRVCAIAFQFQFQIIIQPSCILPPKASLSFSLPLARLLSYLHELRTVFDGVFERSWVCTVHLEAESVSTDI